MAKNSITDYSKTASLNTDIQSVDIDEGCLPSGINNAIRELMADLADMNDGTVSLTSPSFAAASLTGNLSFGDNDKAIFGAGNDLQIYHDGSNSYITDSGTGNLKIGGANVEITTAGGTKYFEGAANIVRLYHTGNQKLATTSTGIDVTGTVTADGLTVDGLIKFSGLAPTVDYDFNADSSVTSADGLAYTKMGSGIATAVDISSVDTISPSWSAFSGSTYSDNKFRIMSARGNSTDALRIVSSLTAEGHGDTTIIGNVDVDGVDTRLVSGLGISGEDINLVSDSNINFRTAGSTRLDIASNGDISFYEDTGTTAKLFWDASAERLGIGTSSPSQPLHISGIAKADAGFLIGNSYLYEGATDQLNIRVGADGPYVEFIDAGSNVLEFGNSSDALALTSAGSERMRITSTGQVGIGTTSPSQKLHVSGGQILLNNGSDLYINSSSSVSYLYTVSTPLLFYTNTDERMRIDSSGNVLVGTTDTSLYNNGAGGDTGVVIEPSGTIQVAKSSNACVLFNRLDSDGIIAGFRKDGAEVGSIGVISSRPYISTDYGSDSGLRFDSAFIAPCTTTGSGRDNAIDLGDTGNRFKSLYLSSDLVLGAADGYVFGNTNGVNIRASSGKSTIFDTAGSERMRIDSSGNVGIGTTSPASALHVKSATNNIFRLQSSDSDIGNIFMDFADTSGNRKGYFGYGGGSDDSMQVWNSENGELKFATNNTERMRINSDGDFMFAKTTSSYTNTGIEFDYATGRSFFTVAGQYTSIFNRKTNDGIVIYIAQDSTLEGSISVSGTTVSYNGGHLARWSQLTDGTKDETIVKGTVMTNLDQMAVWSHDAVEAQDAVYDEDGNVVTEAVEAKDAYTEDNEQLNCMAISSVEGDANVAGVFVNWDNDDDEFNDMNIAMTGDMVIRIAQGTTVARGDLLMSAGDGTAKPQGDDIVRSKTIAKVTSTNVSHTYDDGSYLVPCVLMAC